MAWVAVAVAGGSAIAGAYGAHQQGKAAKAANKAANGPWEETTTRQPWDAAMPYLTDALGQNRSVYEQALADYQRAASMGGGGRRGGRGGGGGGGGGNLFSSDTTDIAGRVRDLAMNRDPLLEQARGYVGNTLSGGADGPFGGNEIYNDLYGRLGGASFDRGGDLISGFLSGSIGSESWDDAGGGAAPKPKRPGNPGRGVGVTRGGGGGGVGYSAASGGGRVAGGGGQIPNTMAQGGFFAEHADDYFDPAALDPANDPTIAPWVEALRREMGEDLDAQLLDVDDASNAVGMYGGSGRALEAARTREEGQEALGTTLANFYLGKYKDAQDRRMAALGMVSERDLAAMGDMTDRYGIDRSAEASMAGSSAAADASRYATDAQLRMGMRGQDLDAIAAMMGHDRAGLEMVAGLGGELAGERRWGTEAAMGLHDQEMGDLGTAFGMFSGMDQARSAARAQAQARDDANSWRRQQQARSDALMPMNMFGDYLQGLGVLTDLGPSTTTSKGQGQRGGGGYVDPGPGAAAAGISTLGGSLMSLYGMGAFDGVGGQQPYRYNTRV